MPIHPEVQQTEIRIADLQRQLEATARYVSAPRTTAPLTAATAQRAPAQAEAAESLNKLAEAARRAGRASQDAAQALRQAEMTRRQELQVDLRIRPSRAGFVVADDAMADGRGGDCRRTDDDDRLRDDRRRRGRRSDGQLPGRRPRRGHRPHRRRHPSKRPIGPAAVGPGRPAPCRSGSAPA